MWQAFPHLTFTKAHFIDEERNTMRLSNVLTSTRELCQSRGCSTCWTSEIRFLTSIYCFPLHFIKISSTLCTLEISCSFVKYFIFEGNNKILKITLKWNETNKEQIRLKAQYLFKIPKLFLKIWAEQSNNLLKHKISIVNKWKQLSEGHLSRNLCYLDQGQ